ncbi:MAG: DMT family transporter [Alphaproteobacteria bacterium]|nr:DMT family transporter [Alphaproteobacteria bacterium]
MSAQSGRWRAIGWMAMSAALVVAMNVLIKHVSLELPVAVVLFFRMAFAIPFALPWVLRDGPGALRTQRLGAHAMRGALGALSMWCWVFGVKYLPLTTFVAISFTRPLWTTMTARLVLGERVGLRRSALIALGFLGVLIAVRPELHAGVAVLVALLGGAVSSLTLTQVKSLTTTEPAFRIVFYFSVFGTLCAAPFALADWRTPDAAQFGWLALSALAAATAQYCLAKAAGLGEASLITPVDFLQLPIAALAGYVLFAEQPDLLTFAGSAVLLLAIVAIVHDRRKSHDRQ